MKASVFLYFLVFQANCADSLARNKAKNALSLATPISPGKAGAKIGKSFDSTIRSESNFRFGQKKNKNLHIVFQETLSLQRKSSETAVSEMTVSYINRQL